MNSVPVVPARLDWPSTIGQFLLNFSTLDYSVFVFLKDHLPPNEYLKVKEWHFKNRIERIALYLKEANYPPERQTAFNEICKRMDPIRELRNHIAHGHMLVRLDEKTLEPTVTVFKAKDVDLERLPDAEHVGFEELLSALGTLSQLIEHFDELAGFKTGG